MGGLFWSEFQRLIDGREYHGISRLVTALVPSAEELEDVLVESVKNGFCKGAKALLEAGAVPGIKTAENLIYCCSGKMIEVLLMGGMQKHLIPHSAKAMMVGINPAVLFKYFSSDNDGISGSEAFIWDAVVTGTRRKRKVISMLCDRISGGRRGRALYYEKFMRAVLSGNYKITREMIKHSCMPVLLKIEQPALYCAVTCGHDSVLSALLESGFNPDARICYYTDSLLGIAAVKQSVGRYMKLRQAGADRIYPDAVFLTMGLYDKRVAVLKEVIKDYHGRFKNIPWSAAAFPVEVMEQLHRFGLLGRIKAAGHTLNCSEVSHKLRGINKESYEYYKKYGPKECGCR